MKNSIGHVSIYLCLCLFMFHHSLGHLRFCDFETHGLCNWTSDKFDHDQSLWFRTTGKSVSGRRPLTDHTYKNDSGYFLYLRENKTSNGIVAELKSETLNQPYTCLTFWYYMYGSVAQSLSVLLVDDSSTLRELWNLSANEDDLWKVHAIHVNHDRGFNFVFKGVKVDDGHVALDDISITGSCLDCDFEHGSCNWDYDNASWKITINIHGYSYKHGYFLAASNSSKCLDKYQLSSKLSPKLCRAKLKFDYFLSGSGSYISVILHDNSMHQYTLSKYVGNDSSVIWKMVDINITMDVEYRIIFEASLGKKCSGRVAVDNITLTYGSCLHSDTSTGTQRTTDAGTSISSGDSKENKILYGAYLGISVGLVAILLIACIVTLIIIRKRRQQASHKKSTVLEMELETVKKQEMASTKNNKPDGKVNESHHIASSINDNPHAEIPDVQFSQVSNTETKQMCNLSSEQQNIPYHHGKVDDVYDTTYGSSSHVPNDETYDHITIENMYDTTNIVKKNTIVDPTYDYTAKLETYAETQTMTKNALTDPTYDHAKKRLI
ncbi:hypothetical protein CHS0354_003857 [Potamilus streckersoni]|uniref:MAM domain-containing protein n=1 Tax=Potamilus streckersoni TaxID=2493646 RepID=A0AAE0VW45_9BIVA|nr:hypothetical protein CHS0354_003857 [Potamilus streckersoni]